MTKIVKPIFIVGVARSGTSILHELFVQHPDTAYFERYSNKCLEKPWMIPFIPLLLKYQKIRYGIDRPRESEGWAWHRFYDPHEYLDESKVTDEIKKYYHRIIEAELKGFSAKRFVNKNPRFCLRIRWLNEMFPDAYFVVIWRDSKAVVNSLYQKMENEWGIPLRAKFVSDFEGYNTVVKEFGGEDGSHLQANINYYNHMKNTAQRDLKVVKGRFREIRYEDFIINPRGTLKELFEFVELRWNRNIEEKIPEKLELGNNEKWKKLPTEERELLEKAFPN